MVKCKEMMRSKVRGMALPMTLFFVLTAFFVASAVLVRAHFEARATVLEAGSIQRESLARAALSTMQSKLNAAGGEDGVEEFVLQGPDGLKARAWFEEGENDIFRLYASVQGSGGRPFVAQKVVKKTPVLDALDVVHLSDGDIDTPDGVKMRVAKANTWTTLTSPGGSLIWVQADRRGNIFANYFPAVSGQAGEVLPEEFLRKFIARNDILVQSGQINFEFFSKVAQAIEDNTPVDLNGPQDWGIGSTMGQSVPLPPTDPDFIRPTHTVVDAVAQGARVQHYSTEKGLWSSISVPFRDGVDGQLPGRTSSDGKKLYLSMMQPGPDRLLSFDLKSREWSDLPTPKAGSGTGGTLKILEVESDDSGFLYCRHGEGEQMSLSRFDPETSTWVRLPSPPGLYADAEGKVHLLKAEAQNWGSLEVDEAGDLFVVWRAPSEAEVQKFTGGAVAGMPDAFGGIPGASQVGSVSASTGAASENTLAGSDKTARDMVLKFHDGEWSVVKGLTDPVERLGSFATGADGRFLIQDIRWAADRLLTLDKEAKVDSAVMVPDLNGEEANYFVADSGGKPIQGRFKFSETAEF